MNTMPVKLVAGDTKPTVTIQLIDQKTGAPYDLSASTKTAKLLFREAGSAESLFRNTLTKIDGGINGLVLLTFTAGQLDIDDGEYEGQPYVEDSADSSTDTCKNRVRFKVYEKFADPA